VEGATESWDFGEGAGFYLNATQEKWKNWRMYDYVTKELPSLLDSHFKQLDTSRASVFGHSMGGHGALVVFLKNPGKYKSVSAFAPIANPSESKIGQKAFKGYLGEDRSLWEEYDATALVKKYKGPKTTILIDQGDEDEFYHEKELLPENFVEASKSVGVPVNFRLQPGYDHSYFFIATFVDDHIEHHIKSLQA
jgi:S-formylglutathione hydrolase